MTHYDYLVKQKGEQKKQLQEESDAELLHDRDHILPKDKHTMKIQLEDLEGTSGERQENLLLVMETACIMGTMESFPIAGIF